MSNILRFPLLDVPFLNPEKFKGTKIHDLKWGKSNIFNPFRNSFHIDFIFCCVLKTEAIEGAF